MDFTGFILAHSDDDTARLLLERKKYPDIDIDLAVTTIEARAKIRSKLPEWYDHPGIIYPTRLSSEQSSSEVTARYKANLFSRLIGESSRPEPHGRPRPCQREGPAGYKLFARQMTQETVGRVEWSEAERKGSGRELSPEGRIADLTGGLGVDCWAFSAVAGEVLYNEMNPALSEAAEHNFAELGLRNISVRCHELVPSGTPLEGNRATIGDILGDFVPDMVFMDPSRRDERGNKVFLIEDCRPDVATLLPEVFSRCRYLLLKLSPMADITMVGSRLSNLRQVHVLGASGECKELLLLLDREYSGDYDITVWDSGASFTFSQEMEKVSVPLFSPSGPSVGDLLFEPGKALMKAAPFSLLSESFNLEKLDRSTHLYICPKTLPEPLRGLGKTYRIREVLPFGKKYIKELGERFPGADVTAKNLPINSDALKKQLSASGKNKRKALPSGKSHIFGLRCGGKGLLLVTEGETI